MQDALKISEPIIVNGEAVIFLEVFGNTLRLAFGPDTRLGADNHIIASAFAQQAVMRCRAFFDAIEGARATWLPDTTAIIAEAPHDAH